VPPGAADGYAPVESGTRDARAIWLRALPRDQDARRRGDGRYRRSAVAGAHREKTSREWIGAWLKNPQAYASLATMPNFQLADEDIRDISAFLIAQSTRI